MKHLTATTTDPGYCRPRAPSRLARRLSLLVQDERDLPFVYLLLRISATLLPLAALLLLPPGWLPGWVWWGALTVYLGISNFRFKGPFGLMLHCTTHRPLFKKQHGWLNHYIPWVIGPLFGQTPESYFTHHLGMHHAENNQATDESSTMPYQRDSVGGFLRYLADFLLLGVARLVGYFSRRHRPALRRRLLRGEITYWALTAGLALVNLPAALALFVLPVILARAIMMLGNWAQHAFIDPQGPTNLYTNSITCINTRYNHRCWNDGYHISHHLRPALHWTEHPAHFRQQLPHYIRHGAIVFDGIHFGHVFFYLMRRRYDLLARHFVLLDGVARPEAEVVALLRARTRRFGPAPLAA